MYYATWIVAVLLTARSVAEVGAALPFLVFLGFLTPSGALFPYSAAWWSLATEVQFYVLLPLLPYLLRSRTRLIGVVGAYALLYAAFLFSALQLPLRVQLQLEISLFGRLPLFAFGVLAAWIHRTYGKSLEKRFDVVWLRRGGADVALFVVLIGLAALLRWAASFGFWGAEAPPRHAWHLLEGGLWACALLLILSAPLQARRLFVNPVLGAVGRVSYSLFLLHVPLLAIAFGVLRERFPGRFAAWDSETVVAMACVFAGCLAASAVTYWTIERPFLVRKSLLDR